MRGIEAPSFVEKLGFGMILTVLEGEVDTNKRRIFPTFLGVQEPVRGKAYCGAESTGKRRCSSEPLHIPKAHSLS